MSSKCIIKSIILHIVIYVKKPVKPESRLPDLFGGDGSKVQHNVSHCLFDCTGSICSVTLDLYGSPLQSVLLQAFLVQFPCQFLCEIWGLYVINRVCGQKLPIKTSFNYNLVFSSLWESPTYEPKKILSNSLDQDKNHVLWIMITPGIEIFIRLLDFKHIKFKVLLL